MTRYHLLKQNEELVYKFVKAGILSYLIIRDITLYERYIELIDIQQNQIKYLMLEDEFSLGVKRIEQIVNLMGKQV